MKAGFYAALFVLLPNSGWTHKNLLFWLIVGFSMYDYQTHGPVESLRKDQI